MTKPTLCIFSGLPGSGKTTLAQVLAKVTHASYLRIDTVEQGLRDLCHLKVEGEGYRLSYRIATDNLKLGQSVVADSCNAIQLTRQEWHEVVINAGASFINIEVLCSDPSEHQHRIEMRKPTVIGLQLPSWYQVKRREYHDWCCDRLIMDTAGKSIQTCMDELIDKLGPAYLNH